MSNLTRVSQYKEEMRPFLKEASLEEMENATVNGCSKCGLIHEQFTLELSSTVLT